MSSVAAKKFRSINDFPALVEYLGDELDWPIETDNFEEMTFEYSAAELGLDENIAPKFIDIRRLRPLDKDQPWGIFFIKFDQRKLPVVALRRLLGKLVLNKRSISNASNRASWHESDLLLISQTGELGTQSISFAHFATNPEKADLPILKILGWDNDDTGLKIDYVIETLREKLVWPDDPTDSEAWRTQWREAFTLKNREVILNSKEMAKRLGTLAFAVRNRLREVLTIESDEGPIHKLMLVFKENLISDLDTDSFSDMYAQTIAYGLLSARIINPKANTADAAHTEIPITNPFLRDLMDTFLNVGGRNSGSGIALDFDELGINEVVDLLDNTNMEAVLRDFGDRNQKEDPVMHFFEGFLEEYDSKIRKDRGVFYTPQPVVSFIVRSVDEQLRSEFGLKDGLADTTTWGELAERTKDLQIPAGISPNHAFVQILDPATGTGTFPVEVIDLIYKTMTAKWQSQGNREAQIKELWNEYVPEHLLPRLHGYELMMAPYAIAHMKIGLKLHETGYRFNSDERARIFLTNALEPAVNFSEQLTFIIPALAKESKAVNAIKRNKYFSVIIGNPPYLGEGGVSKGWIGDIMDDYKKEPGGQEKLKERNPKWLNDLYVKFIRMSSYHLELNRVGIMGLITNHSYLDNPTFRGMRWHLLQTFKKIYILDLHGNSKKREKSPNGMPDKNIFDIQQGVALMISVMGNHNKENNSELFHCDLWGERNEKYKKLHKINVVETLMPIKYPPPYYFFVKRDFKKFENYEKGFSIKEMFILGQLGFQTHRDNLSVSKSKSKLIKLLELISNKEINTDEILSKYKLKEGKSWKLDKARERLSLGFNAKKEIAPCYYRPFDKQFYLISSDLNDRPRKNLMIHIKNRNNLTLCVSKQLSSDEFCHALVSDVCAESCFISNKTKEGNYNFPLYLYSDNQELIKSRNINFDMKILKKIELLANHPTFGSPNEIEVFDYVYGVLYSPQYRTAYLSFLKSDFPKIPWPSDSSQFWDISQKGKILRKLHLMNEEIIGDLSHKFIGNGDNYVDKVHYESGKVIINQNQYFEEISEKIWKFKFGSYQPAQKWLKDREQQTLTSDDVLHYQKILKVISKTDEIMQSIHIQL